MSQETLPPPAAATPPPAGRSVLLIIFLLTATDFLQSGMTAFGAGPISGELSLSPEDFSLVAAVYAAVAIVAISLQRWLVERFGPRRCVQVAAAIFIAGSVVCASSDGFGGFLSGRVLMAIGGGGMFTTARMVIHHCLAGPRRFLGIKCLAGGLSASLGIAPWLVALAVTHENWAAIYWLTAGMGAALLLLAGNALPARLRTAAEAGAVSLWHQLLLLGGSLGLLVGMQRLYYDFYGESAAVLMWVAVSVVAVALYLRWQHRSERPLLRLRPMLRPRYLTGLAIFLFAYTMLGANNVVIPQMLQRTFGYGWGTVGNIQALGFSAAFATWWVMMRLVPKSPSPKKFLVTGFSCLSLYGALLSRLTLDATVWWYIVPALALNSVFLLTVMPVTAMQSFREMEQDEALFANAQQLKNMMSQAGIALGIMLATVGQQRWAAVHYPTLTSRLSTADPAFQEAVRRAQASLGPTLDPGEGARLATAMVFRQVEQQALLLANIDYFQLVAVLGLAGAVLVVVQRVFR